LADNNGQFNKSEEMEVVDYDSDQAKILQSLNANASPMLKRSEINLKSDEAVRKTFENLFKSQPKPKIKLPQNLVCEVCSKSYETRSKFTQHLKRVHPEKLGNKKCHFCDFNSSNAQVMKTHVLWNHKEMK